MMIGVTEPIDVSRPFGTQNTRFILSGSHLPRVYNLGQAIHWFTWVNGSHGYGVGAGL